MIKRDCYWYHCEHQMGASIDCCTLASGLGDCPCSDDCRNYITNEEVTERLKTWELQYTPREVRNALMDYGQHDLNIKLGEVIKYDPVQVEDILMNGREATRPVTPHMVDWGIYECPKCKTRVDKTYKYCKVCGRSVKWE